MNQESYRVRPIYGKIRKNEIRVSVPGSKSITNRALLLAALADGESVLKGVLFSEDSRYFLECIQKLGFETAVDEERCEVRIKGLGGKIPNREASLYVGSAGTAARFLTAFLGMSKGRWYLDASAQMRRRPMKPLLDQLEELGATVEYEEEIGHFPFWITGNGIKKQEAVVDIERSSQFLSALLISSCLSEEGMCIKAVGKHGMAYIEMTVRMMEEFGLICARESGKEDGAVYVIEKGQRYRAREYEIEPDVSAASYFYAMAAFLGIRVTVPGVFLPGKQGDVEFLRILERMGCTLEEGRIGVTLTGPAGGALRGVDADMSACSDQAITLAAIAPFAASSVTIRGIGHIRFQESDRIEAIRTELTRMGIVCEAAQESITIHPGNPAPAQVHTYEDHRMAMGFSLTGLRAEGIEILDPGCCKKTFENYFKVLDGVVEELAGAQADDAAKRAKQGAGTGQDGAGRTTLYTGAAAPGRIDGGQIFLRPITMEDTQCIVDWRNTERVRRNFIYQKPFTKEGHEAWMRTKVATGGVVQFIICEKEDGRPVGSVYFRDIDRENKKAEYGIFIGEADALGHGIGTETAKLAVAYARDALRLHKLYLRVFADNAGAIKSYRNAGFVQEAYLKDEVLQDGKYRDMLRMAVLFEENR